jgi:hypothetical protein
MHTKIRTINCKEEGDKIPTQARRMKSHQADLKSLHTNLKICHMDFGNLAMQVFPKTRGSS